MSDNERAIGSTFYNETSSSKERNSYSGIIRSYNHFFEK